MSTSGYLNSSISPGPFISRPSSRNSLRSSSPIITLADETLAIRTHMSTLKHTIRHQQAQLHTLENVILRGPRPLPPGIMNSPPLSPTDPETAPSPGQTTFLTPKLQKRASYDILQGLAGPDSSLPLPRRDMRRLSFGDENGIREGIPTSNGRRAPSPTRTLSRIPVSSVGNARALAEEGQQDGNASQLGINLGASSSSATPATSPNRRSSFAPGNTTRVLADLQAGVLNAKTALENTKAQLRISQRQVSQLTRQTEDLKEVRERLRMENEGLNNVVARKERLLQETLERARKAEADIISLKTQLKSETTNSKKSLRDTEAALVESTARSQKAEREYIVLRDSFKGLVESFQSDTEALQEEMRKREEKVKREAEELGVRYGQLVEEVRKEREGGRSVEVQQLKEESERLRKEMEESFRQDIGLLKAEVEKSGKENEEAWQTAKYLADELARLRRLMRAEGSSPTGDAPS
ncbi:hypothetical protein SCP_1601860 [Sparassis crispa]|uniref:SWI5-dependent HO expression protein 3 n=1 Tax=Sparassis crispa TaxID=139825 RepID=A0A401H530_9APHY|nr:hypothetical protein SCP_1601860 [Sparassis crispa]GBE89524.1 hypothetical protein SCP_1601860 [Sparassis crispa]